MGVIDTLKEVGVLIQKLDNVELNRKILDLQREVQNQQEENRRLRGTVEEFEALSSQRASLVFEKNAYWRRDEETEDGPYCSGCHDGYEKLVRLHLLGKNWAQCPRCQQRVELDRPSQVTQPHFPVRSNPLSRL